MLNKHPVMKGAMILTVAGLITRVLGFLYRIFLSNLIGAEGMGIFQLIFPILTFGIALSCGGIQIAVSRFVAESKSPSHSFTILSASLFISLGISAMTLMGVGYFATPLSVYLIKNRACADLLQYSVWILPMNAIHSCITGYYLGLKKIFVPAWSGVVEQIAKIISVYMLGLFFIQRGSPTTPSIAVFSMIISEITGVLFCLIAITGEKKYKLQFSTLKSTTKKLLSVSYLLTLNRILLTFLQCAEAILVPIVLVGSGVSNSRALSIYGILTGMALPVVTFPCAITNSISSMILPSIAESKSNEDQNNLIKTTEHSIRFSMISGIFCIGLFLYFGNFIGIKIFGHMEVGMYIRTLAWLCPFLYLSMTLGSVLHGLGKTTAAFIHNLIGILIRLISIWWGIPIFGIKGWLWGLLLSHLTVTLMHYFYLKKILPISFSYIQNIIRPTLWTILSLSIGRIIEYPFNQVTTGNKLLSIIYVLIQSGAVCIIFSCYFINTLRKEQS